MILNSILASQIHSLNEMQKGLIGSLIAITYLSCIVLLVVIYQLNRDSSQGISGRFVQMAARRYRNLQQQGRGAL